MNTIHNKSRSPGGLVSLLVTLLLLAFIVLPASAFQLTGQDVSAGAVGETVEYPVILDEVPDGLAGFDMTVTLTSTDIGEITAVRYPDWVILPRTGPLPADSVSIRGLDLEKNIGAGSHDVILANLTLRADAAGTTPVTVTIKQLDADNGDLMSPTIRTGSFTVAGVTPAPVADFSADMTSGDAPLTVRFTDLSTGDGITAWAWDFDNDGNVDSNEQNPEYTYASAGTYSVKLVVSGAGGDGEITKTDLITVTEPTTTPTPTPTNTQVVPPVGNFAASPLTGDAPLDVFFTDESTGDITSWSWDVNNDGTDECTTRDCSYTYNDPGTYTVKLTVSNDGGSDVVTKPDYIVVTSPVIPAPVADFSADTTSGDAPLTVRFTDLSTGEGITAWAWDFDNDGTVDSNEQNPEYTYSSAGTYSVKLVVTGTGGDGDSTKADYITVTQAVIPAPVAGFFADNTSGAEPFTVRFADASTGDITGYAWDFDSNGIIDSTEKEPVYTYSHAGTFTVTLNVTGPGGYDDEIKTDYITVTPAVAAPDAKFSANPLSGVAPLTVQFTDESTGDITAIYWDFTGDLQPDSTDHNPSWTFNDPGVYTIYMGVTGPGGMDYAVKTNYITVLDPAPVAAFSANQTSGDAPLAVLFTDESTGKVTSWAWDFENDGTIDSTEQSPAHVYGAAGTYAVSLTVTGPGGSDDEAKTGYITVAEPLAKPVADFTADPLQGAAPLSVQFTDASTGDAISAYAWDFENDGTIDSTDKNPQHVYAAAGSYTVNLTVSNTAGNASEVKADYIVVSPAAPVANFSANATSGPAPLAVLFTDESTGDSITAWAWDFESDGIVDSNEQNPAHEYSVPGAYNVSLTVTNAGGSNTLTKEQYITATVTAPAAGFTANITSGYAPLPVQFTDASTGTVESWAWDFQNDGTVDSSEQNPDYTYTTAGNYSVNLTVANGGGSNTSVRVGYINVSAVPAPVVDFSANLTTGYAPLSVQFTDDSKGIGLISWSWDFNNDGTVDSTEQNPVHTYGTAGNYTVALTVKGRGGSTTATKTDYISVLAVVPAKPRAEFVGKPTSGTAPLTVKFTDKSIGKDITSWAWDFNGDGITDSSEKNPEYVYATKGSYNVSLTVTNAGGSDTRFKKNYIKVSQLEKPSADFKADKQSGKAPLTVKFTDMSRGDGITERSWDFNNDGVVDSTEKNPTFTYSTAGSYAVKLVVTNAAGSDMEIKSNYITVKGGDQPPAGKKPVAVMFADKTWGTPPMTVRFADKSLNNPTHRVWYFGDGSQSLDENPTHLYAEPGIYFARLYVSNDYGSDQDFRFIFVLPKWLSFWATGPK
ncbi:MULTISPECIES: PKD domain-containing protein [unclassified Methanoregula]|uniref:PKD domain-containing protein n=1 Tax=unclassified Methanoregula TaxID=2649730 RepID=UPI0009D2FB4E|nr:MULTISPECIES: PKD domain-containing protein [unclassified Methanoregula]OPX63659.1 MAG: PKD domain protein [Methanoregula sp. PtaB.Bin085]OPY36174.1 MAG: PKD domain protein [Methanoregula sp. PtaU1.Bin006]